MSINKNTYIVYRHNTEWFLKTMEEFWNSVTNCYIEPIGVSEVKRLKNDYFTISFDESGAPKFGEIIAISRHKVSSVCDVIGEHGLAVQTTFDHNFVRVPMEGFMAKGKIKDLDYLVKLKDISMINYIFSDFAEMTPNDSYQLGMVFKKIFNIDWVHAATIPNSILFNSQLKIVFSFVAGIIDAIGENNGIGFYIPIKNNHLISQITFLLCRVGVQYYIKNGIYINILDNFNTLSELRGYLRSSKKYISNLQKNSIVNRMPFKGEELFDYIKKYNATMKDDKINYLLKKNNIKKKSPVIMESYVSLLKELSLNKINKWHNNFLYEQVKVEQVKNNDFVYDLTINSFSHIYIVGHNGWCLLHNKRSKFI